MYAIAFDNMSERLLLIQVNDGRRSSLSVCVCVTTGVWIGKKYWVSLILILMIFFQIGAKANSRQL